MHAQAHATISGTVRGTCEFIAFGVAPLIAASMMSGCLVVMALPDPIFVAACSIDPSLYCNL
jgi:hypothetical protein